MPTSSNEERDPVIIRVDRTQIARGLWRLYVRSHGDENQALRYLLRQRANPSHFTVVMIYAIRPTARTYFLDGRMLEHSLINLEEVVKFLDRLALLIARKKPARFVNIIPAHMMKEEERGGKAA